MTQSPALRQQFNIKEYATPQKYLSGIDISLRRVLIWMYYDYFE